MTSRLFNWIMQYEFSEHYGSESSWKEDFDRFKRALKMKREELKD